LPARQHHAARTVARKRSISARNLSDWLASSLAEESTRFAEAAADSAALLTLVMLRVTSAGRLVNLAGLRPCRPWAR
jgi:hypothetical protein